MKNFIKQDFILWKYLIAILIISCTSACDKDFEEMNKNPNAYNEPVLSNTFSLSLVNLTGPADYRDWGNGMYAGGIMQYFGSFYEHWTGEKYLYDPGYNDVSFNAGYRDHIKLLNQILALVKDQPDKTNLYAMTRILKVYAFHKITDFYGDIPYFEAGNGYIDGTMHPRYDTQADIYADMLKELDESANLLDPSKSSLGSADFIYNGNVEQWKRFANSLMLRLGMRLTKIDLAKAETYVKKAIAGGVMESNSDIAKVDHTDNTGLNWNWDSYYQVNEEHRANDKGYGTSKLSNVFINFLKDKNDPRLPFYATLWEGNVDPSKLPVTSDPAIQKGLPCGFNSTTIKTIIPNWTDEMYLTYSEINLNTLANMAAPSIFQSYAEVELLLAEAVARGWKVGDVKDHYEKGVTAAMDMVSLFPGGMSTSPSAITKYLTDNPFVSGTFDQNMQQIHNQYWVCHFFWDNIESFSNWRRTGYPVLIPTNYPGNVTGGVIPRRLLYPESEKILNTENYNAAVQIQGPDLYTTRVWWDKE